MSPIVCRLCGSQGLYPYYALGDRAQSRYYKRRRCKLVNYDLSSGMDQARYSQKDLSPKDETHKCNRDQAQTYYYIRRRIKTPGSMTDIGCFNARILYPARMDGWRVKGLDLSDTIADLVREEVGIDIAVGNFLDLQIDEQERFDVVVMRHVLEHIPDSVAAMNRINALLKVGGHAVLEFPNIEGYSLRLKRFPSNVGIRKNKYPPDWRPGHCNEFCRESFEFLVSKTGFVLNDWQTYSSRPINDWIYRRIHIGCKARALLEKSQGGMPVAGSAPGL